MTEPALPIATAARLLRSGALTSEALTRRALDRIAARDGELHAFVHVDPAGALAAARRADAEMASGRDCGPLHGVPYALKDIYDARGMPTRCGSRLRAGHVAKEDSAVAERLRTAGAVLLGKLDTFEFALGGPDFELPYPPARNPWDRARVPGGSSSGSGAAIAAGYVALAPGTCTTGSIRGPAAWCGAVGLKPTFGRVSRRGVQPLSGSLDHCGPITRTVEDAAIALAAIAGHDPADPQSAEVAVPDYCSGLEQGVEGLRLGVPWRFFRDAPTLTPDALGGIEDALALLSRQGARVTEVTLPAYDWFMACGRVLMIAEAFAIHRDDLARRPEDFGPVAARRFSAGVAITAADYIDALCLQRHLRASMNGVFGTQDVMLTAISLAPPPPLHAEGSAGAWAMQATPFNVSGHPAVSVPVGVGSDGLPLAVQIAGRTFDEATILRVARTLERLTGWEEMPLPAGSLPFRPAHGISRPPD